MSIDSGKLGVGVSLFDQVEHLSWAAYVSGISPEQIAQSVVWSVPARFRSVKRVVIERPQIYQLEQQKGDQNDLIDVALVAGACGHALHAAGAVVEYVLPHDWKGNLPKDVTRRRVDRELTTEELEAIVWPLKHLRHNVYDAIHLGLRHFTTRKV